MHGMDYLLRRTKSPRESIEKAIELAQKAVAQDDHGSVRATLATLYAYKGEYDKALAEGERAMALDPSGAEVHASYGSILNRAGRPEEAIPMFQRALRLNPFPPASYYSSFGSALLNTRRFEEAVSAFKKALQLSPDSIWAHYGLAYTYIYAGRPEEAIPFYQKVIQLSPSGPFYFYSGFGVALRNAGQFEEAVSAYKKALQLAPDEIVTHIGLAVTYIMMGREKEARAEAEEVLRINPKFSPEQYAKRLPYRDRSFNDRIIDFLRKAGVK